MTLNQLLNKLVDGSASKAEEMEILEKIAEKCGTNSYLLSLFTPDLIQWVRKQITDDVPPDMWATLFMAQSCRDEKLADLERLVGEHAAYGKMLDVENERLRKENEEATALAERVEQKSRELAAALDDYFGRLCAAEKLLSDVASVVADAWLKGKPVDPERLRDVLAPFTRGNEMQEMQGTWKKA